MQVLSHSVVFPRSTVQHKDEDMYLEEDVLLWAHEVLLQFQDVHTTTGGVARESQSGEDAYVSVLKKFDVTSGGASLLCLSPISLFQIFIYY